MPIINMPDGRQLNFPDDTPEAEMRAAIDSLPKADIDTRTGAPLKVRSAVGAATRPEDRLATLQKFFPEAQPQGDDNFVYNNPKTQRQTLYNPKGFDVGDVASVGPEASEMLGGTAGGALAGLLATPAAPATGGLSYLGIPVGYGLGAAGGRDAYTALSQLMLGTVDKRGVIERLGDTGLTTGVNAIGGRLAELMGQGIKAVGGPIVNRIRGPVQPGQPALTDFANTGVTPSMGPVTGNRSAQIVEKGLSNMPGSAGIMQRQAEQQLGEIAQAADATARSYGTPLTVQGVGEVLQTGAQRAGARFAERRAQLDDTVENLIGRDTRVPVMNVNAAIRRIEADIAQAPNTRTPQLQNALDELRAVAADATDGGIPFGALRQARTSLGRNLERPDVSGYTPGAEAALRRAYGTISEDITAAAKSAGPDAERALATHDRYVRFNRNINIPVLDALEKKGTPEEAFKFAMNSARDGGSKLYALRRNLQSEEWDSVAGSVLGRLGRTKGDVTDLAQQGGDFSVSTFLTNFKNLAPEARSALWAGTRYEQLTPQLNTLARVAERLKDADKMANPSGTARNLLVGLGLGAAGQQTFVEGDPLGGMQTLAVSVVTPRVAAHLVTNPAFVRWLAGATSSTMQTPGRLGAELARLVLVAKAEPEIRSDIHEYINAIKGPEQR